MPARLWGRYAIAGLEADCRGNKKTIARLGQELGIVSRETSLIVLETAEDYAQYDVTPPASLQARVEALRLAKAASGGERNLDGERLLSMWRDKVKWWETEVAQNPKVYSGEKITLNFVNEDVHNIIRMIGDASGKNIVVSGKVKGGLTLGLVNTPWDQALEAIVAAGHFAVEEADDLITVYDWPTFLLKEFGQSLAAAEWSVSAEPAPGSNQLLTTVLSEKDVRLLTAIIASDQDELRLRAAPRIMAANDRDVSIKQGKQIPYHSGGSSAASAKENSQGGSAANAPKSAANPSGQVPAAQAAGPYISIKPWLADAPYIARMKAAKDDELYAVYLDERPDYLYSSAFYFDVADRFFERGLKELGLRVLSNLAEIQLENRQILRVLAYRLMQAGEMAAALPVLERVRDLAPYEPQSLRDLAIVQAALGQTQEAVDLLYETACRQWSNRFGEINLIALTEMNALIAAHQGRVKTGTIDPRLIKNLPSDFRVVLSWDMDNTNMDLKVTAPDGEVTNYYSNRNSKAGGRLSGNCVQGYGPEEFMLKKAIPGIYRVWVRYAGDSRQTIDNGDVTVMVTVYSKFGTPAQKEERSSLRLRKDSGDVLVSEFVVKDIEAFPVAQAQGKFRVVRAIEPVGKQPSLYLFKSRAAASWGASAPVRAEMTARPVKPMAQTSGALATVRPPMATVGAPRARIFSISAAFMTEASSLLPVGKTAPTPR